MSYQLLILRRAQKELSDLPKAEYIRVRDAIALPAEDARPHGCRKLVGRDAWRIRAGDFRVIYEIDHSQKVVTDLNLGHRRDIYS